MSDTTVGAIAFSEGYLGEFPTKIQEVPIKGADIKATFDYSIPKRKGRPKGSKNKTKELTEAVAWPEPPDIKPAMNPDWIHVVLKSEVVEDGLPMIVHTYSIKGVSKLPDGGASIILNFGGQQPMILTTFTPYEKVASQILETEAW